MTVAEVEPILLPPGTEEPWPDGTLVTYSRSDRVTKLAYVTYDRSDSKSALYGMHYLSDTHRGFYPGGSGYWYRAQDPKMGFHLPSSPEEVLLARHYIAEWRVVSATRALEEANKDLEAIKRVRALS